MFLQQIAIDMRKDSALVRGVFTQGRLPLDQGSDSLVIDLKDQEVRELGTWEEPIGGAGYLLLCREVIETIGLVEGRKRQDLVLGVEGRSGRDELVDVAREHGGGMRISHGLAIDRVGNGWEWSAAGSEVKKRRKSSSTLDGDCVPFATADVDGRALTDIAWTLPSSLFFFHSISFIN